MKKYLLGLMAIAGLATAGIALPTAANAQEWHHGGGWHDRDDWRDGGHRYYHGDRGYWHEGVRVGYYQPAYYRPVVYRPVAYYPPVYRPVAYYPEPAYYNPGLALSFNIR